MPGLNNHHGAQGIDAGPAAVNRPAQFIGENISFHDFVAIASILPSAIIDLLQPLFVPAIHPTIFPLLPFMI
jgi:hypothetical protein